RATNLAVIRTDANGRMLGDCTHPQRTWSLLHGRLLDESAKQLSPGEFPCPVAISAPYSCRCVADSFKYPGFSMRRDRAGLVHFSVPLLHNGEPLGALVAGQVFDRFPDENVLHNVADRLGIPFAHVWRLARLEKPIKLTVLRVYANLLVTLAEHIV